MIETLNNIDTQLFYFLNGLHCTGMDWVMWVFTARWSWLIIIVAAYLLLTTRTFHLSPFTFHLPTSPPTVPMSTPSVPLPNSLLLDCLNF